MSHPQNKEHGFTLVELLITMLMTGVIVAGMFSVYQSMQRTTYNQTDIVDVQQSLRIAVDLMGRDVRMAGFLSLAGTNPLVGSDATNLNIVTASSDYTYARLAGEQIIAGGMSVANDVVIDVANAEMLDFFAVGERVRIIRPNNGGQPHNAVFTIAAIEDGREDLDDPTDDIQPTMTLNGFSNTNPVNYVGGDMIARVNAGAAFPSTVSWSLDVNGDLQRVVDGVQTDVLVTDVDTLQFDYLYIKDSGVNKDNVVEDSAPYTTDDRGKNVAVRVTLTATAVGQMDQVDRLRSMSGLFKIMN